MTKSEYQNSMSALVQLAQNVVRTEEEQNALISEINHMHIDAAVSDRERIRAIVGMFYDGLAYGNWPWIVNGVNTLNSTEAK